MKKLEGTLAGLLVTVMMGIALKEPVVYAQVDATNPEVRVSMDNQPESSYWFPDELLKWTFDQNTDAKYNVSVEPLATRVEKSHLLKSNTTQNEKVLM
ncbi:TPA: hypothetical protein ACF1RY_001149 [Enterococcus hirae]